MVALASMSDQPTLAYPVRTLLPNGCRASRIHRERAAQLLQPAIVQAMLAQGFDGATHVLGAGTVAPAGMAQRGDHVGVGQRSRVAGAFTVDHKRQHFQQLAATAKREPARMI